MSGNLILKQQGLYSSSWINLVDLAIQEPKKTLKKNPGKLDIPRNVDFYSS